MLVLNLIRWGDDPLAPPVAYTYAVDEDCLRLAPFWYVLQHMLARLEREVGTTSGRFTISGFRVDL